jgi:hypothetical protein
MTHTVAHTADPNVQVNRGGSVQFHERRCSHTGLFFAIFGCIPESHGGVTGTGTGTGTGACNVCVFVFTVCVMSA